MGWGILIQSLILNTAIFAQGRLSSFGANFRGGTTSDVVSVGVLVALLAIIGVVVWVVVRRYNLIEKGDIDNPKTLFLELCKSHDLNWGDRRLLGKLAVRYQLKPSQLFIQPERFELQDADPGQQEFVDRVHSLRDKIFAGQAEPA